MKKYKEKLEQIYLVVEPCKQLYWGCHGEKYYSIRLTYGPTKIMFGCWASFWFGPFWSMDWVCSNGKVGERGGTIPPLVSDAWTRPVGEGDWI